MKPTIFSKTSDVLEESADAAKRAASAVSDGAKSVRGTARDAARYTGRQIRRYPFAAALTAIGAGILIGFLIGRKSRG